MVEFKTKEAAEEGLENLITKANNKLCPMMSFRANPPDAYVYCTKDCMLYNKGFTENYPDQTFGAWGPWCSLSRDERG